ncbi:MAG: hypothetical protein NZM04_00730 [Methylacidiphilales bacterium]|nr:hypothetical protein [Candidatus Methylacidiphilales bacterium]
MPTGVYLSLPFPLVHPIYMRTPALSNMAKSMGITTSELKKRIRSGDLLEDLYKNKEDLNSFIIEYIYLTPSWTRMPGNNIYSLHPLSKAYISAIRAIQYGDWIFKQSYDVKIKKSIWVIVQNVIKDVFDHPLYGIHKRIFGKNGLWRGHLCGKRVIRSGRAVIYADPHLTFDVCSLPKIMAERLFCRELPRNYAGLSPQQQTEALNEIGRRTFVALNRPPTLHRLNLQAFHFTVNNHAAIGIHPLVCQAFNADFDGDQMNVFALHENNHLLSESQRMMPSSNLFRPADATLLPFPDKDIRMGIRLGTRDAENIDLSLTPPQSDFFEWARSVLNDYVINTPVKFKNFAMPLLDPVGNIISHNDEDVFFTTLGRLSLYSYLPPGIPFINRQMNMGELKMLLSYVTRIYQIQTNRKILVDTLDGLKSFGLYALTKTGVSFSLNDFDVDGKIIEKWQRKYNHFVKLYSEKEVSAKEAKEYAHALVLKDIDKITKGDEYETGAIIQMTSPQNISHAFAHIFIGKNFEDEIEIKRDEINEGDEIAMAGYTMKKLAYALGDIYVVEKSCGTKRSMPINPKIFRDEEECRAWLLGRYLQKPVEVAGRNYPAYTELDEEFIAGLWRSKNKPIVNILSPLFCTAKNGLCANCCGNDLASGEAMRIGTAIGLIAAQSLSEAIAQLKIDARKRMGNISNEHIVLPSSQDYIDEMKLVVPEAISMVKKGGSICINMLSGDFINISERIVRNGESLLDYYSSENLKDIIIEGKLINIMKELRSDILAYSLLHFLYNKYRLLGVNIATKYIEIFLSKSLYPTNAVLFNKNITKIMSLREMMINQKGWIRRLCNYYPLDVLAKALQEGINDSLSDPLVQCIFGS